VPGDTLPVNPGVARLLDAVRASKLLGPDVEDLHKNLGEAKLRLLKSDIENAETPISGFLLARQDGVVQMRLTPFLLELKAPIAALLNQSYMLREEGSPLPDDLDDARLSWDVEELKETAKLPKELETFIQSGGFKPFPPEVEDTLRGLAVRALKAKVLAGVGKAARREIAPPSSESRALEIARSDIASLAQAGVPLREMLAAFGRMRLNDVQERLRALIRAQGSRLLLSAERVLERSALYEVKDGTFAWWNGEGAPVFEAFGAPDVARLAEYVVVQRSRADTLARELAEPVLALLESAEVGVEGQGVVGMATWQRVITPLRDYESKKAGNSVSTLERFILTDLPTITFENCLTDLDRTSPGAAEGDFFASKKRRISGLLRDQCVARAVEDTGVKYASLRRMFNRHLADRFPFVKLTPGVRHEDAAPEAVRTFVQSVGDFRKRYREVLVRRGGRGAPEVVRFLDRMESVRSFFEPMWRQAESASDGTFDVRVEFRVNTAREVGGHQIAAWSAKFAEERLTMDGPKSATRWRVGEDVRLQLRWAKNSFTIPAPEQEPSVAVSGRTVTFEERGAWALLRMLAARQISALDPSGKTDASGHILALTVNTVPDPCGGFLDRVGVDAGITRVFVRVSLSEPDKDKQVKYPEFPTSAPVLVGSE
jgi:type VI secretion system protein ImpL